jgi:hypothetical protein
MKFNPTTGQLEEGGGADSTFLGVFATDPATAEDGNTYINSVSSNEYVYYGGTWWIVQTLKNPLSGYYMGFGAFTTA